MRIPVAPEEISRCSAGQGLGRLGPKGLQGQLALGKRTGICNLTGPTVNVDIPAHRSLLRPPGANVQALCPQHPMRAHECVGQVHTYGAGTHTYGTSTGMYGAERQCLVRMSMGSRRSHLCRKVHVAPRVRSPVGSVCLESCTMPSVNPSMAWLSAPAMCLGRDGW